MSIKSSSVWHLSQQHFDLFSHSMSTKLSSGLPLIWPWSTRTDKTLSLVTNSRFISRVRKLCAQTCAMWTSHLFLAGASSRVLVTIGSQHIFLVSPQRLSDNHIFEEGWIGRLHSHRRRWYEKYLDDFRTSHHNLVGRSQSLCHSSYDMSHYRGVVWIIIFLLTQWYLILGC